MTILANVRMGKKLGIVFGALVVLLAFLAGLSLWALNSVNSMGEKAQAEAHKLTMVGKVDSYLSGLALRMVNLTTSTQLTKDMDEILALRKEYTEAYDLVKASSQTTEEKRLLGSVDQVLSPWRELNNQIMESARTGKRVDAASVRVESMRRFASVEAGFDEFVKYREAQLSQISVAEEELTRRVTIILVIVSLITIIAVMITSVVLTRSIAGPLTAAVSHLDRVANGDLSHDVPREHLERGDEIGLLSKAIQTMSVSLRDVLKNISSGVHVLSASSAELSANSGQMSEGSRQASDRAHAVAAAAEQMTTNVTSVAAGMEQTTTNLTSVASATEQMTATIGEIAGNSEKARRVTEEATRQAVRIGEQMNKLGEAAREIGKVTETITEISSQTNLLALNATIEAARAGTAGKGFAVVANEIKELAQQTAAATEDIKARIAGVQSSTSAGIAEIDKVSQVIQGVSEIVSSIAAAIEEQATVTKDIARNIGEASTGVRDANVRVAESSQATRDIAREIAGVDQAAGQMAEGSEQVRTSATELSRLAEQLQMTVARFHV